jgi:hypothetical protein
MEAKKPANPHKAIGLKKTPLGWVAVEYQIEDGKIVSQKASEPELRVFALEKFAREAANFWDSE